MLLSVAQKQLPLNAKTVVYNCPHISPEFKTGSQLIDFYLCLEVDSWNLLFSVISPVLTWLSPKFTLEGDRRFYNNLVNFCVPYSKDKKLI